MSFRDNTKLIMVISSALTVLLVAVIAIKARNSMSQMSRNNSELYSAYKISELLKSFRSSFNALENKRKGYIITGDAKFLEAYRDKESEIKVSLKSMERYFSGRAEEESYYKLKDLTYRRLMSSKSPGTGADLAGFQANGEESENSNNSADEIMATVDEINESLDQTTIVLLDNSIEYVKASRNWSIAGVILTIIVSIAALFIVIRDMNTRNLLEKELRRAKLQADENSKLKEQFVANISHEIRTPLNAILGFTNLLDKTKLNVQQKSHLDAIQRSSSNLLNIINDILDFSKIEAGQLNIEKISFSLNDTLEGIRQMFENKSREKNIIFEVRTDKGVPAFVYGDPNRLAQILINLLSNAIKFTERGKVSLICEVKSIEHDLASLVFRVKDSGIGIPAEKLNHVFERFKQASSDTTRKYGGTGLGLSIVKDLVELQNGSIQVKSKEGQGSEFIVNISYPVSSSMITRGDFDDSSSVLFEKNKYLVLLVEDNELNQKLAKNYLESFGLTVDLASDGKEATEKIKKRTYDLVLMDIQMPVMDGYQATQYIRDTLGQQMPVIAMTANSISGEKEKCIGAGMNDYISKPYRESELRQMMHKHLDKAESAGAGELTETDYSNNVDLEDFHKLTRGNRKFMEEMIELFISGNPEDLARLKEASDTGNYLLLKETAHRMKTSVGFMGLKHLSGPLSELEILGEKKQGWADSASIIQLITAHCKAAQKLFKNELHNIRAAS